ncbi:hypothetical protein BKA57DRAFT_475909 [Linnemannia elongata]|nr:hypothetical protein BKA57DRAFT_475909 [Linnemannia elongata]
MSALASTATLLFYSSGINLVGSLTSATTIVTNTTNMTTSTEASLLTEEYLARIIIHAARHCFVTIKRPFMLTNSVGIVL